jgi:hypothetical protein
MRVEAARRSISPFFLCSVLSKRTRQLAIQNPSSRIAELIVLACHEFMDGKLWFNPLTAPTVPIEDAAVLRVRWQSEAMPDAAANGTNPCNTIAKSHSDEPLPTAAQAVAARAAP